MFWIGAAVMGIPALAIFIRFVILFSPTPTPRRGHIQSLIAGAVLFIAAMLLGALGVIGDLLDAQRTLSQRTFERVRRIELQLGVEPSHYEPGRRRRGGGEQARRASGRPRAGRRAPTGTERPRTARHRGMTAGTETVPTGNTFDKYGSTNPVVRRLMAGFERHARPAVRAGRTGLGARRRLRRGGADRDSGPRPGRAGRVVGIDLEDPKLSAEWAARAHANLEFRIVEATQLPFARR